jgi:hypothetical protein
MPRFETSNNGHKLKASDFPSFHGKDNEDMDEWIEKVSAIFEFSGKSDAASYYLRVETKVHQDTCI